MGNILVMVGNIGGTIRRQRQRFPSRAIFDERSILCRAQLGAYMDRAPFSRQQPVRRDETSNKRY